MSNEFGPQARRAFENLRRCLEAAGSSLGEILAMTVLITDMRHREELLGIRKELLSTELCTSLLAAVLPFGREGCLIEIQATALSAE